VARIIELNGARRARPFVALLAHASKRDDLRSLVRDHHRVLRRFGLLTTRPDGDMITRDCLLPVERTVGGIIGEDLEIAARVADGTVCAVIFLRDPLPTTAADPDVHTLLRVCDLEGVPMATNTAAAEVVLHFLRLHGEAPGRHLEPVR
jgi:methylglyoxal synthase